MNKPNGKKGKNYLIVFKNVQCLTFVEKINLIESMLEKCTFTLLMKSFLVIQHLFDLLTKYKTI